MVLIDKDILIEMIEGIRLSAKAMYSELGVGYRLACDDIINMLKEQETNEPKAEAGGRD